MFRCIKEKLCCCLSSNADLPDSRDYYISMYNKHVYRSGRI